MKKSKKILIIISIVLILILAFSEIFIYIHINNTNIELREFQNSEGYSSGSVAGFVPVFILMTLYTLRMWDAVIIVTVLLLMWIIYAIVYFIRKRKNQKDNL